MRSLQPARDLLAGRVLGIEVVIARADQEPRLGGEPAEIFLDHHALGAAVDDGGDVEMVAGHDHHVEIAGDVEHPVELRQRIMEVGYQEQSHRGVPTLLEASPKTFPSYGIKALSREPLVAVGRSASYMSPHGEVPEWSNGTVSKTVVRVTVPWVRIPPSPPTSVHRCPHVVRK